jgi:hypothetical protein
MEMTIAQVREDYVKERTVLQAWKARMDATEPDDDIPPETLMSPEYRTGWKIYLDSILKISARMIALCDAGNVTDLKKVLNDEATEYDALSATAQSKGLTELAEMLTWEAKSRRDVANSLP